LFLNKKCSNKNIEYLDLFQVYIKMKDMISEIVEIKNEFRDILSVRDKLSNFRVGFNISYNMQDKYYSINIFPKIDGFDSQKYFKDNFEGEYEQEKLSEFADKYGVGLITY
jgi:hypothetical protein